MNDFRKIYQDAVSGMESVHIDINSVLDEGRRRRLMKRQSRQKCMTAIAGAGFILLCTFGTVQAADYVKTIIKVNENGFQSGDPVTIALNEGAAGAAGTTDIPGTQGISEASVVSEAGGTTGTADSVGSMETGKMEGRMAGGASGAVAAQALPEGEIVIEDYEDGLSVESVTKEYDSVAKFREEEDAVFVLPDLSGLGYTVEEEHVWVSSMYITARIVCDGKSIFFDRMDYTGSEGHASSTAYPGGVCNERIFLDGRGYEYILIDSKKEKEDEPLLIHAAVSVGSYEMYADFNGFTEEEAERILESMDLSAYEQN